MPRKDHHATIYANSMIAYGGQFQNGHFSNELICFDFDNLEWKKIYYKQNLEPFINGACCSVNLENKKDEKNGEIIRLVSKFLI